MITVVIPTPSPTPSPTPIAILSLRLNPLLSTFPLGAEASDVEALPCGIVVDVWVNILPDPIIVAISPVSAVLLPIPICEEEEARGGGNLYVPVVELINSMLTNYSKAIAYHSANRRYPQRYRHQGQNYGF